MTTFWNCLTSVCACIIAIPVFEGSLQKESQPECPLFIFRCSGDVAVNDSAWHSLHIDIFQQNLTSRLDSHPAMHLSFSSETRSSLTLMEPLFIGGWNSAVSSHLPASSRAPLQGCVRALRVNRHDENLLSPREMQGSGEGCPWGGGCASNPCRQPRECIDVVDDFRCQCPDLTNDCDQIVSSPPPATTMSKNALRFVIHSQAVKVIESGQANVTQANFNISIEPNVQHHGTIKISIDRAPSPGAPTGLIVRYKGKYPHIALTFTLAEVLAGTIRYISLADEVPSAVMEYCIEATGDWPAGVVPPRKSCGHKLHINISLRNDEVPKVWSSVELLSSSGILFKFRSVCFHYFSWQKSKHLSKTLSNLVVKIKKRIAVLRLHFVLASGGQRQLQITLSQLFAVPRLWNFQIFLV